MPPHSHAIMPLPSRGEGEEDAVCFLGLQPDWRPLSRSWKFAAILFFRLSPKQASKVLRVQHISYQSYCYASAMAHHFAVHSPYRLPEQLAAHLEYTALPVSCHHHGFGEGEVIWR
ncbi:hypothetical protein E6O75_ATG05068 [Venturia nashicola]|uniref:Uncharacterized protein n=1 Tax=Venturia nashicola TaxID=86259 RepID=A0A4Z1P2Q9_9PEZI|nr:hypothetical protein E6O75_ATG05068 [Venturia nashicola]